MKDFGRAVLALLVISALVTIFYLFLLPLFIGGKVVDRQSQKFDAETQAQVYDNSRTYQQSTQLDISKYCVQYHEANAGAKKAVADLIRDTAATYNGPLTDANKSCLAEIGE